MKQTNYFRRISLRSSKRSAIRDSETGERTSFTAARWTIAL
jgi:hypothetical protein